MIKIDDVPAKKYKIYQDDKHFKYTTDSLILSSFARPRGNCVDLGCGTGILSLRLIDKVNSFINIDLNKEAIELLDKSVAFNGLEGKIKNYFSDIKDIDKILEKSSIDTVVVNPPYYNKGLRSKGESIDKARYSDRLNDFIEASGYLLNDLGRFYCVLPATRMIDVFEMLISQRIEPKRLRFIRKDPYSPPKLILIEAVKFAKRGYFFERDFILKDKDLIGEDLRKVYEEV
ncbi:tRNA1(Val) (adenine(37)-N6)-methyltransferase [Peptoniphilus catoniae]|uniref:tRNA1(Val) (adenine(37)-N6)-methyltransferase n=1 Tax=Peptoniphilus catoniae TaxID=1660341 RepID=UPI0010FEC2D7|nr:methyltransferase [Peptoniphilus catoniae]